MKDNNYEDKKTTSMCFMKRKLKFEDYKKCLVAAQIENKITHLGKNKIDVKQILKTQQRFESENEWQYLDDIYKNIEECNPNKK